METPHVYTPSKLNFSLGSAPVKVSSLAISGVAQEYFLIFKWDMKKKQKLPLSFMNTAHTTVLSALESRCYDLY